VSLTIAFVGFGEVGQLFARQLMQRGDVEVAVYDILFEDAALGQDLKRLASEIGARPAASTGEACRGSRFVISAVTADAALAAARQAAPALAASQVYIDLNSVSPTTKRQVAEAAGRNGAEFVEFAVMAPVSGPGIAVPILAGGRRAGEVAAALNPLGMTITPVSPDIGVASATKLCRSIVIKGMEALMVDLNLAAGRTGVLPAVLESLTASYPGMDWEEVAGTMPGRVKRHGRRRAAEMREVSRMMGEMGLDGSLAEAIAARHESFAETKAVDGQPTSPPTRTGTPIGGGPPPPPRRPT
jgi:3-hydroxyisobutyrate dehydrogenase-like beta-hydroxyacid dehydrogenase